MGQKELQRKSLHAWLVHNATTWCALFPWGVQRSKKQDERNPAISRAPLAAKPFTMLHVLVDPPLAHCVEEEGLPLLHPHVQMDGMYSVQCTWSTFWLCVDRLLRTGRAMYQGGCGLGSLGQGDAVAGHENLGGGGDHEHV